MPRSDFHSLIEQIKADTDIVSVIGQYIPLDPHLKAKCPFHADTVPSLSINAQGRYFFCFGCGAGGDVIDFVRRIKDLTFMGALGMLAHKASIPFPEENTDDGDAFEERRQIEEILVETAHFYHGSLTGEAMEYLTTVRRFTEETIALFRLGFASGGLQHHLLQDCGFPLDLCIKAGIIFRTDEGNTRDFFINRIIFPTLKHGRVVFLQGRSLGDGDPKYLNLPGRITHLFHEDALSGPEVIVTEGAFDCIAAVQAGHPAVGLLGTNLELGFLPKFSRCRKVHLCLDGDEAGRKGAIKIGELLGEKTRIVDLPDGIDLSVYFKTHTGEDFAQLLSSSKDIIRYMLSLIPQETSKTDLPDLLEPVFHHLAKMDKAKAEAYLFHDIKERFRLKVPEVTTYRAKLNNIRNNYGGKSESVEADDEAEGQYTAYFGGLIDLVEHHGQPAFLQKDTEGFKIAASVERNGVTLVPPPKIQIPWLLPRGEEVMIYLELDGTLDQKDCDGALFNDLLDYLISVSELPLEEHYTLLAAWVLHSYLQEAFQYTPYICFFAVPERGKSRTGKGLIYVAYRGMHIESLRSADLVRSADRFKGSIFFDVMDIWKKAEKSDSEDILLLRYEKGAVVRRVNNPDRGPFLDTDTYEVFGPTLISTNRGAHRILETRSIVITMPASKKDFDNDITPEVALPLKERLVAFRARHLGEKLPAIPKPAPGRLGDILKPLLQIIRLVKPDQEPAFLDLVKKIQQERRMDQSESMEAEVVKAVLELETSVVNGALSAKVITDKINENRDERSKITPQKIGRILKALGFSKARAGNNHGIRWDSDLLEQLKASYGLKETYESYETHVPTPKSDQD